MKPILVLALFGGLATFSMSHASDKGWFRKRTPVRTAAPPATKQVRYTLIPVNSRGMLQLGRVVVSRDSSGRIVSVQRR
ncbi:MAG: hypothetical protein KGR69_03765 [Verrucomicrobia bacterium]|nr:hypothetical protein [Verrucomicrobiota bacterium]